jgi:hypothetical protein
MVRVAGPIQMSRRSQSASQEVLELVAAARWVIQRAAAIVAGQSHAGGFEGLPEVVGNVWPLTTVQTCIIHLIRRRVGSSPGKGVWRRSFT